MHFSTMELELIRHLASSLVFRHGIQNVAAGLGLTVPLLRGLLEGQLKPTLGMLGGLTRLYAQR